ncbi:ABC transporter ATP-binding protein [Bradyrhizobium sp. INPA01-394B]|uniref:ABC transporter ATP-binding protein n=1 Tax=Bradyrhizobium campsiandrae TaxID=1729892 RepID=A0ABR7U436_9BRAD|nr:oligopeptide/dipeptide ABC transporter ATP-binding protein [Bradyrhizobium campsiandrae]MBC9879903.1 ABC transporter ATP-binding protein [Bradyrhizobium campsiandrae]MBC9978588.1 ABC transporter ATP-binding protein [Bradyrhizobium campsiandrae]
MNPVLEVHDLDVSFDTSVGSLRVVRGVSFSVGAAETVAIVGESGSGKSVTALSLMRLHDPDKTKISGSIKFKGTELLTLPEARMRTVRGNEIGMIFQEPMSSLNPLMPIGDQIAEAVLLHHDKSRAEARRRALDLLVQIGIADPQRRMREYPHQLSGGMRQRVMIAMAMACDPEILIADEPTTALDVTVQAQILGLMRDLKTRTGSSIVIITHDLGVVAELADRVVIMYAGVKVEEGTIAEIFSQPAHPYTVGLLGSIPSLGCSRSGGPLTEIPGQVPSPSRVAVGCSFAARCGLTSSICLEIEPRLENVSPRHGVACHHKIRTPVA